MTILFDRIVSVGGWVHGVDERDIGTELPLRCTDFEAGVSVFFLCVFLRVSPTIVIAIASSPFESLNLVAWRGVARHLVVALRCRVLPSLRLRFFLHRG